MSADEDGPTRVVDAAAKLIELQQEWERSCAFLAKLEASIAERPCFSGSLETPTVWVESRDGDDDEDSACHQGDHAISMQLYSSNLDDSFGPAMVAPHQEQHATSSAYARPIPIPQINMKFQSPLDQTAEILPTSPNALRQGALLPRQPKPPPLQRAASLRQKGPPPLQRTRLLRALTLESSLPNSDPITTHSLDTLRAELATASPPAPSASAASTVHIDAMPAFKTVRRFSMDHEQLRVSPVLVPTPLRRRESIGAFTDGAAVAAARAATVGGTLSLRRMKVPSCEAWGSTSSLGAGGNADGNNSFGGGWDSGSSGCSAAVERTPDTKSAPLPQLPIRDLPPLFLDPARLPPPAVAADRAPLLAPAAAANTRSAYSRPTVARIRSSRSFHSVSDPDCGVSTSVSTSVSASASGAAASEDDSADSVPAVSAPPRSSQPRPVLAQSRLWQSGHLQPQSPQGPPWTAARSPDSGFAGSPSEGVSGLLTWRSKSMPRSPGPPLTDDTPALLLPHPPLQPRPSPSPPPQQQQQLTDDISFTPQMALHTRSLGLLRLTPIPEAPALAFARRSTGQVPDSNDSPTVNPPVLNRLSSSGAAAAGAAIAPAAAGGKSGGAGGSGRFSGRSATEFCVAVQSKARRGPRLSLGSEVFGAGLAAGDV